MVVVGPGLPDNLDNTEVPEEVRAAISDGEGAVVFEPPQDQSTCDHLEAPELLSTANIVNGRCDYYEAFAGSHSWVTDDTLEVPEVGLRILSYLQALA